MRFGGGSAAWGVALSLALQAAACHDAEPPPAPTPTAAAVAAAAPTAAPTAVREALPRAVGAVTLRMARAQVEQHVGALACRNHPDGFEVCTVKDSARAAPELEVFFHHREVISLAYTTPAAEEVWTQLEALTKRYGTPSLKGLTERDRSGRLHEIYGWRDPQSLYSVRFIWQDDPAQPRRLLATGVTLWDREAYAAWEAERARASAATPGLT
jgi:hypothetical protein